MKVNWVTSVRAVQEHYYLHQSELKASQKQLCICNPVPAHPAQSSLGSSHQIAVPKGDALAMV